MARFAARPPTTAGGMMAAKERYAPPLNPYMTAGRERQTRAAMAPQQPVPLTGGRLGGAPPPQPTAFGSEGTPQKGAEARGAGGYWPGGGAQHGPGGGVPQQGGAPPPPKVGSQPAPAPMYQGQAAEGGASRFRGVDDSFNTSGLQPGMVWSGSAGENATQGEWRPGLATPGLLAQGPTFAPNVGVNAPAPAPWAWDQAAYLASLQGLPGIESQSWAPERAASPAAPTEQARTGQQQKMVLGSPSTFNDAITRARMEAGQLAPFAGGPQGQVASFEPDEAASAAPGQFSSGNEADIYGTQAQGLAEAQAPQTEEQQQSVETAERTVGEGVAEAQRQASGGGYDPAQFGYDTEEKIQREADRANVDVEVFRNAISQGLEISESGNIYDIINDEDVGNIHDTTGEGARLMREGARLAAAKNAPPPPPDSNEVDADAERALAAAREWYEKILGQGAETMDPKVIAANRRSLSDAQQLAHAKAARIASILGSRGGSSVEAMAGNAADLYQSSSLQGAQQLSQYDLQMEIQRVQAVAAKNARDAQAYAALAGMELDEGKRKDLWNMSAVSDSRARANAEAMARLQAELQRQNMAYQQNLNSGLSWGTVGGLLGGIGGAFLGSPWIGSLIGGAAGGAADAWGNPLANYAGGKAAKGGYGTYSHDAYARGAAGY